MMNDKKRASAYTTKCLTSLRSHPPETPKKKRAPDHRTPPSGARKKAKTTITAEDEDYVQPPTAEANKDTESTTQEAQNQPEASSEVLQKKILLLQKVLKGMNTQTQGKNKISRDIRLQHDNFATLLAPVDGPDGSNIQELETFFDKQSTAEEVKQFLQGLNKKRRPGTGLTCTEHKTNIYIIFGYKI